MLDYIKSWLIVRKSEKGQDLAEYALLIGLIALIVVAAVMFLGGQIDDVFSRIGAGGQPSATWLADLPSGWVGRLCRSLVAHPLVHWAD